MIRKLCALNLSSIVVIGSLGGHKHEWNKHRKKCFQTAQYYQLVSTFGLYLASYSKYKIAPVLLIQSGCILFCTHLYNRAFNNNNQTAKIAPIGGILLMSGIGSIIFL